MTGRLRAPLELAKQAECGGGRDTGEHGRDTVYGRRKQNTWVGGWLAGWVSNCVLPFSTGRGGGGEEKEQKVDRYRRGETLGRGERHRRERRRREGQRR